MAAGTVLSQSSNFIAMRLTNADDQAVIKKLLPDSIGNFADLLPVLDIVPPFWLAGAISCRQSVSI